MELLKTDSSLCLWEDNGTTRVTDGLILIPEIIVNSGIESYDIVSEDAYKGKRPIDTSKYNDRGLYAIIRWNPKYEDYTAPGHEFKSHFLMDIYSAADRQPLMSDVFEVGDVLDMTGTPAKLFDTDIDNTKESMTTVAKIKIKELVCDEETRLNTIVVENNTYRIPKYMRIVGTKVKVTGTNGFSLSVGTMSGQYLNVRSLHSFGENSALIIYDEYVDGRETTVYEWDYEKRKFVAEYNGTFSSSRNSTLYSPYYATSSFQQYVDQCNIIFKRAVPELDFICERDNRLWGVSNKDGTIYASGLGIPWLFYDYSGTNMDSYAVAVGSGGDFTAIVNYNGILCFKENTLHKVLGNLPSEFYINTYEVPGVQKGAHMSAKAVNELLYYKSPNGIVNFTGYQPSNISRNLLMENTVKGVAASDGREYYVCVQAKDESHYSLFKYDITTRLWLKEEDVEVHAMTRHKNNVYMAITTYREVESDGEMATVTDRKLYVTGQENGEVVDWFARFKPFIEDVTINNSRRKVSGFARFILRFEMEPGSVLYVKTREDNGVWHTVWTRPATNKAVHTVPIRIGRCDKFEVELSGKGNVKIVSMKREVIADGKPNDVY